MEPPSRSLAETIGVIAPFAKTELVTFLAKKSRETRAVLHAERRCHEKIEFLLGSHLDGHLHHVIEFEWPRIIMEHVLQNGVHLSSWLHRTTSKGEEKWLRPSSRIVSKRRTARSMDENKAC